MALDTKLTQNINLRANGDQLLKPLEAFGREINKVIGSLGKMSSTMSAGNHASEDSLRKQVQMLQRLVGEAATLQNLLTSSKNRKRDNLFSGLEEQALGKKALGASKLKQTLVGATSAADALEIRLAKLYRAAAKLGDAGGTVSGKDLAKTLNTEKAITDVRKLETELQKLDARAKVRGGLGTDGQALRTALQQKQDTLLNRVQTGRRSDFSKEIAEIQMLVEAYRKLTRAEESAATASERVAQRRRVAALNASQMDQAQLRASINRQSSQYSYSPTQARTFNGNQLDSQITQSTERLNRYGEAMQRAINAGRGGEQVDRLASRFNALKEMIAQATAQKKAFDNLPEQRMKNITKNLFADGGLAFGARIMGAGALATGAFALINGLQNSVTHVVQLEDALARLQAIAGATDQQMAALGKSITEVSTNTRYSVTEIVQAATQIAQAGFSASETATVLKDSLTLATASGSSPSEAVDTVTSALGAFQLQATESTRVVDTLVNGLNRSKLSINQMQQAIQYAGATAKENGVKFEELVAISASLANAGIRSGSTIGTGMRQLLVDLKTPTDKFKAELKDLGLTLADVDVKALGVAGVVKKLTDAGFSAEAAYESFEVRAASSFLAFKNQIGVYDDLALAISRVGAAQEANDRAMDSVSAKWTKLLNVLSQLVTSLSGPLMGALKVLLDSVTVLVSGFNQLNEMTNGYVGTIGLLAAAFAINPFVGVAASIVTVIGLFRNASDKTEELMTATLEAEAAFQSQQDTVNSVDQAIADLITREKQLTENKAALATETVTLTSRFEGLSGQLGNLAGGYDGLLEAMLRYRGEALKQAGLAARQLGMDAQAQKEPLKGKLADNINMIRGYNSTTMRTSGAQVQNAWNLGKQNLGTGLSAQNQVQAALLDLKNMKSTNSAVRAMIDALQKRLDLMRQIDGLNAQISQASTMEGLSNERGSAEGQLRDRYVLDAQRGIDAGLSAEKDKPGTGTRTIDQTLAQARRRITALRNQLATVTDPKSPRYMAIESSINQLEGEVAKVTRSRRIESEEAAKNKDDKADVGVVLPAAEVKRRLIAKWPQLARAISFARQRKPGDYGYDKDSYHAKPGGNAIDIDAKLLPKGISWEMIAGAIEEMGQQLVEAPPEAGASGAKRVGLNHGSAPHGHFAYKGRPSQYQSRLDSQAEKEAQELQRLLEMEATGEATAEKDGITAIIAKAKAGIEPIELMKARLTANIETYKKARLAAFDVANPLEGQSETNKKIIAAQRANLVKEMGAEAETYWADFTRATADAAKQTLDAALEAAKNAFAEAQFKNGAGVRAAESDLSAMGNRANRNKFGAGTQYRLERNAESAGFAKDKADLVAMQTMIDKSTKAIAEFDAKIKTMTEGSAAYKEAMAQREAAVRALNAELERQAELQGRVNDRERDLAPASLKTRLEDAARAWLDNSGAMDSWSKQAENAVGPTLDFLTTGLTDLFYGIMSGTKSVKQALGDFLKSFAQFVLQMIAKALALAAVKAILKAIGLDMPTAATAYNGGEVVGANGTGASGGLNAFNGGPVKIPGRMKGGVGHLPGGGSVNRGFTSHDSALYNLAAGEYVVRGKSVREIGVDGMDQINKHGAAGLAKMGGGKGGFMNIQQPKQETNVFVVSEKGAPPMGPTDVLVTIHEDIMQGGATKKLIKQVAQGG